MKAVFIFHHLIFPSQKLLQFTVGIHFRFFIVATSHQIKFFFVAILLCFAIIYGEVRWIVSVACWKIANILRWL